MGTIHLSQNLADAERHPLDVLRMELFKLPQEQGEGMVAYSNRILDIADECDLNDITQQEIMAMVFITHCRSTFKSSVTNETCGSRFI